MNNYLVQLQSKDLHKYEIFVAASSNEDAQELALSCMQLKGLTHYRYSVKNCTLMMPDIDSSEIAETRNGDCIVPKKILKSSEYLYNVPGSSFKGMSYEEVLVAKIKLTKMLIDTLLEEHYMTRDTVRINDVLNAQKFNEKLIKELEE
jgi:hypothetical protein